MEKHKHTNKSKRILSPIMLLIGFIGGLILMALLFAILGILFPA